MRDGMITEEQCGENFAYILEDKTDFLITEYKMMHGQNCITIRNPVCRLRSSQGRKIQKGCFLFWEIFCMKSEG